MEYVSPLKSTSETVFLFDEFLLIINKGAGSVEDLMARGGISFLRGLILTT